MPDHLAYLASPYTRYIGGLARAFRDAAAIAAKLRASGIFVYSPIVHCHPLAIYGNLDPLDLSLWYPHNEVIMERCDALIVAQMLGWESSAGIQYEVEFFSKDQKPIFDLIPATMKMTRRDTVVLASHARADFALWGAGI